MPPGLSRAPGERGYAPPRRSATRVPRYIREGLQKRPRAWSFFLSLAPSYRRSYVLWIDTAKRPETRAKRLKEAVRLLASAEKLGLR
jgi:uncharacterized protein YdeI (YjbR/CyaY-like superfamily)